MKKIRKYFHRYASSKVITSKIVDKFLSSENEINDEVCAILKNTPEWVSKRNVVIGLLYDYDLKRCLTCGKLLKFRSLNDRQKFCSAKCVNSNETIKQKKEDTIFKHFGVRSVFQNDDIKGKIKETCMKRYGVDHALKRKDIYEKVKQTNKERYGVEFLMQSKEIYEKRKNTCLMRYDVINNSMTPENRLKTRIADLKRGYKNILSWKYYVIPMFSLNEYEGFHSKKTYKWKCVKCGNIFEQKIRCTKFLSDVADNKVPRCLKCFPISGCNSAAEILLIEFCEQHFSDVIKNDRKLINPFELDIVILEIKLAH